MGDEVRDALVAAITEVEKTVARKVIAGVVDRTVLQEPAGRRLLAQLTEDPGMLLSGSTRIPRLLDRILLDLAAAGARTVRPPGCAHCGRVVLLSRRDGLDRICEACGRARLAVLIDCVECERNGQLRHAQVGDRAYCRSCWRALKGVADERLDRFVAEQIPGGTLSMMLSATEGWKADRRLRLALECELFGVNWIADPPAASVLFATFYERLRGLGARVRALACGHCGRIGRLPDRLNGRMCCRACYKAGHMAVCDGCGDTAHLELRRPNGDRFCQSCTNRLPESSAECIGCGIHRLIAVRTPDGPMCSGCRTAPGADVCTVCGTSGRCRFPGTSKAICVGCYAAARVDVCHRCGRERECRFASTAKAICTPCALQRKPCSVCARVVLPIRHTPDGEPLCWSCAPHIVEACIGCGRDARVSARTDKGPLCQRCARTSPLMFRDCRRCGAHGRLHRRRWCDRCYADDKIRELLSDDVVAANPMLGPLRDRFLAADERRTLDAFRRNTTVAILREALSGGELLSHALLDRLGSPGSTAPVRALLAEHGLIPARDEQLVRFDTWCQVRSAQIVNPDHRRLFDRYVRWRHLRQLRDQTDQVTPSQSNGRRQELLRVLDLMSWLTGRSESLAVLDQPRLDLWLLDGPPLRRRVAAFLEWAARSGTCPRLHVPPLGRTSNTPTGASVDERWELLGGVLTARGDDPRTRLAGALLLLFGIPVARLHLLRVTDITAADPVMIRLGPDPLELPEAIGQLAIAARAHRDAPRLLTDAGESDWLFPGQHHGAPLSRDSLTDRLAKFGIRARHTRAGALASLAQELPAPVIARLTGLHITAATRWAEAVVASNARYSALTDRHNPEPRVNHSAMSTACSIMGP
ncbi:hypothetical protein E0W80_00895 [Microbacterium sp. PI-1]|uniref:hypothetical protein n=1 Tax=unclassified Microbacterium TaxID=2609290 RepID=UPI00103AE214|nr:hypothetical protein [Microbacterium sp. PI-1]MCB1297612.1 hypothetical protein [Microthrixaceae bacterium]TCJ29638.1 hypothetical protein E0W80_00895 [Microbacterium sp. PI-1]